MMDVEPLTVKIRFGFIFSLIMVMVWVVENGVPDVVSVFVGQSKESPDPETYVDNCHKNVLETDVGQNLVCVLFE